MTEITEERENESVPLEEPVEEVQISDEAQQIAEDAFADSSEKSETDTESEAEEPVAEPAPEEDAAELKDRLLRALADLENTRRRAAREVLALPVV